MENKIKTVKIVRKRGNFTTDITEMVTTGLKSELENAGLIVVRDDVKTADLTIAVGGDGTFLDMAHETNFNSETIYVGINTGNLGFLQEISPDEVKKLIEYLKNKKYLNISKIEVGTLIIKLKNGEVIKNHFLNECLIGGKDYSRIDIGLYSNGNMLQNISATAICLATPIGQTAYSINLGGPIVLEKQPLLITTLLAPINNVKNKAFINNSLLSSNFHIEFIERRNEVTLCFDNKKVEQISIFDIESIDVSIGERKISYLHINYVPYESKIRGKLIFED